MIRFKKDYKLLIINKFEHKQAQVSSMISKQKYQQKDKVVTKYNFIFDESTINYKTQIPQLPIKLRSKPDQKKYQNHLDKIHKQIQQLKQQRKIIKSTYKQGSQTYDIKIEILNKNVILANKCLIVLHYDIQSIQSSLKEVTQKIQKKQQYLKKIYRLVQQKKHQKKQYDQMTYQQLQIQQNKLSIKISTANLNKKQQTQINALLNKIKFFKNNPKVGPTPKDNAKDIENTQQSIYKLKNVKQHLQQQLPKIQFKITSIQKNIVEFTDEINSLEQQKKSPQNQANFKQKQRLKKLIYSKRDQLDTTKQQFQTKKAEYEYQQAKIQWIKWAKQIKDKIQKQWQQQKQQKRKQRLRQKLKQKQGISSQNQQKNLEDPTQKINKPKFSKYQNQIDKCTFLISYCNGLIQKKQASNNKKTQNVQIGQIQNNLKNNQQWNKLKDVQILQSKKSKKQQQDTPKIKPQNKKNKKQQTTIKTTQPQKNKSFTHNVFILQYFDLIKVVPPNTPEQVQNVLNEINSKLTYFMENPYGGTQQSDNREGGEKGKPKYTTQKNEKIKYVNKDKKIKTEDFPSLS